ncbi:MAG: DUF4293 domain-containing protein [Bacteroidales bacterium]|nr:DUF4293 domain-containing protein [Bacteroidales bacterium]
MIQRIQTLYLLLIVILSGFTLFSPVAGLFNKAEALEYVMNYRGIFLVQPTGNLFQENVWALTAISAIIPLISLLTIFVYKKRLLQIRLTIFNIVLMAGYYGLLFIYLWLAGERYHAEWFLEIVTAFPLVNIILSFLAIRAIGKDEALVKSLNRLR